VRGRARALGMLGRNAESEQELKRGLTFALGVDRNELLSDLLRGRAQKGDETALPELEKLARDREATTTLRFNIAQSMGALAGAAKRTEGAEQAASAALAHLRELKYEGYFRSPMNMRILRQSPMLDSVRRRAEFEELLRTTGP